MAAAQNLPEVLEWLGAACGRSKFSRFFDRSLLVCALVLLPWLFRRIRRLEAAADTPGVDFWTRVPWKSAASQLVIGGIIAGGMLWGMGAVLAAAGAYEPRAVAHAAGGILSKILLPAVVVSLLEEGLFRGLLLGLWLRFARPAAACLGTSLMFAFLHFLKPPAGMHIADPSHPFAGFQLLGKIAPALHRPVFFCHGFRLAAGGGVDSGMGAGAHGSLVVFDRPACRMDCGFQGVQPVLSERSRPPVAAVGGG